MNGIDEKDVETLRKIAKKYSVTGNVVSVGLSGVLFGILALIAENNKHGIMLVVTLIKSLLDSVDTEK